MTKPSHIDERLAVVLSHPTQYYSPWFRWLRAHSDLEFRVFYLWDFGIKEQRDPNFGTSFKWDVDLLSGYDYEFVPNASKRPGAEHFFGFNNPDLTSRLAAWRPTAMLLFGYKWASHLRAIAWARLHRIPILFRGDSHLIGRAKPSLHVQLALRALYSQIASFLYVGVANREYFKAFHVPDAKLTFAPHSVNAALFDRNDAVHLEAAAKLRQQLRLGPSTRVVLFAGKFVAAKQPVELLKAFVGLNSPDTFLLYVGDGEQRDELLSLASAATGREGGPKVGFLPFANQSEMPSRLLLADLFVLPSRGNYETWGLAVNEAMHMGVPCLVSNRVGCQRDLVTDGETGWVFDPDEPAALGQKLSEALEYLKSPANRESMRGRVEGRIAEYSYARTTAALLHVLGALRGQSPKIQPPDLN